MLAARAITASSRLPVTSHCSTLNERSSCWCINQSRTKPELTRKGWGHLVSDTNVEPLLVFGQENPKCLCARLLDTIHLYEHGTIVWELSSVASEFVRFGADAY